MSFVLGRLTGTSRYGPVAQLEERIHGMDEVRGSSPLRSTSSKLPSEIRIRVVPRKVLSSRRDERLFCCPWIAGWSARPSCFSETYNECVGKLPGEDV